MDEEVSRYTVAMEKSRDNGTYHRPLHNPIMLVIPNPYLDPIQCPRAGKQRQATEEERVIEIGKKKRENLCANCWRWWVIQIGYTSSRGLGWAEKKRSCGCAWL